METRPKLNLPIHIIKVIREAFKNSGKFASRTLLENFCEMARLPENIVNDLDMEGDVNSRIDMSIGHFLRRPCPIDEQYVIYTFLDALVEFQLDTGGKANQALTLIREYIQPGSESELPVICFVMNHAQAQDLFSGKVNPVCPQVNITETDQFTSEEFLQGLLRDDGEIISRYSKDDRDEWIPYKAGKTLKSLIELSCQEAKSKFKDKLIKPKFYSAYIQTHQLFRDNCDDNIRRGAICIVDFISLLHPDIWKTFRSVNWSEEVSIVMLLPEFTFRTRMHAYISKYIEENLVWYYYDHHQAKKLHREYQIGNLVGLERQLIYQVHETHQRIASGPGQDAIDKVQKVNPPAFGAIPFGG